MRNACWAISFLVFSSLWLSQNFFVGCWSGSEVALWYGWCSCPISSSPASVCVLTRQSDPDGFSLGKANTSKYNRNITKQCQTQMLLQFPHHGLGFCFDKEARPLAVEFCPAARRATLTSRRQCPFYINKYWFYVGEITWCIIEVFTQTQLKFYSMESFRFRYQSLPEASDFRPDPLLDKEFRNKTNH